MCELVGIVVGQKGPWRMWAEGKGSVRCTAPGQQTLECGPSCHGWAVSKGPLVTPRGFPISAVCSVPVTAPRSLSHMR